MDWLLLALIVPTVLVPIVLLFGFCGCSSFETSSAPEQPPLAPTNLHSGLTGDKDGIVLTWTNNDLTTVGSRINRTNESESGDDQFDQLNPLTLYIDTVLKGLKEGATYRYTVESVRSDISTTDPSNESKTTMPPAPPTDLVATGVDLDEISLTWKKGSAHAKRFRVWHRLAGGVGFTTIGNTTDLFFPHKPLAENSTHEYRVSAIVDGFHDSVAKEVESTLSDPATGTTLSWKTAYSQALNPAISLPYAGNCVVQRIDATQLIQSGQFVRVFLRGLSGAETRLAAVTISNSVPVTAIKGWDSLALPVPLRFGGLLDVSIPNGQLVTSDKVKFKVTAGSIPDLAIAMDVAPNSQNLRGGSVAGMRHYFRVAAEATKPVRSAGYTTVANQVCCIEKIEVA